MDRKKSIKFKPNLSEFEGHVEVENKLLILKVKIENLQKILIFLENY